MYPEGFLLIERDKGIKEDYGGVHGCVGKSLRGREGRGREGGMFLDRGVGEGKGGFDVKGQWGHV
jgi:hypothetical protein